MLRTTLPTVLCLLMILGASAYAQPTPSSERYAPGVVLVKLAPEALPQVKPSLTAADLSSVPAARQALGQARFTAGTKLFRDFMPQDTLFTSKREETVDLIDLSRWYRLEVEAGTDIEALAEKLMAAPEVLAASPDYYMYSNATFPDDPEFEADNQWGLYNFQTPGNDIHAPQAWDIQTGRSDVVVAIIDSGVDYEHPDLDPGDRSRVIQGYDFFQDDDDPDDCKGHGTPVAGVVGAITDNDRDVAGVMWDVQLMPVRVGPCSGQHLFSDVAQGFDYARQEGADIINISLSFPDSDDPIFPDPYDYNGNPRSMIVEPITNAWRSGVLIVASAGNNGLDDDYYVEPPASYHMVMAVGASNRDDRKTDFSAYGNSLDVVAPGTGYSSTRMGGGVESFGGTSNASPMTAGVAGLLLSESRDRNLGLTGDDLREIIRRTADNVQAMGGQDFHPEYGDGRVNAYEALRFVQAPNTVTHFTRTDGTVEQTWGNHSHTFYRAAGGGPLANGVYYGVRQYRVSGHVSFSRAYQTPPQVWAKMSRLKGWDDSNPLYQEPWINITNVTTAGFDYETYVYWVTSDSQGRQINAYYPSAPDDVDFGFTVVGRLAPLSASISGPAEVTAGRRYTWTGIASGGAAPYSYHWEYYYDCDIDSCTGSNPYCRDAGGGKTPALESSVAERLPASVISSRGPDVPDCGTWKFAGSGQALSFRVPSSEVYTFKLRLTVTDAGGTTKTVIKTIYLVSGGRGGSGGATVANGTEARSGTSIPEAYALDGAAPNPFRDEATVRFALPEPAEVTLTVYDLVGREVAHLAEGPREAGWHTARFDGRSLPSGVYVVRLTAGDFVGTSRVTLLR